MNINAVDEWPDRTAVYTTIDQELRTHAGIDVHQRKTQLWNRTGVTLARSEIKASAARVVNPTAIVWRKDLNSFRMICMIGFSAPR